MQAAEHRADTKRGKRIGKEEASPQTEPVPAVKIEEEEVREGNR